MCYFKYMVIHKKCVCVYYVICIFISYNIFTYMLNTFDIYILNACLTYVTYQCNICYAQFKSLYIYREMIYIYTHTCYMCLIYVICT